MNTKDIFDVKKGRTDVNYLYLGNRLVWKRPAIALPEELKIPLYSRLLRYYPLGSFVQRTDPADPESTIGYWYDRISGIPLVIPGAKLNDAMYCAKPGVHVFDGGYSIDHPMPKSGEVTYYIRLRTSRMNDYGGDLLTIRSADGKDLCLSGNKGSSTVIVGSMAQSIAYYAHRYYTLTIVVNNNGTVDLYCDGESRGSLQFSGGENRLNISGTAFPPGTSPIVETIAIYDGAHDEVQIAETASFINELYPFSLPDESKRTYLYDHGDEKEALTGGWELYAPSHGYYRKTADCIEMEGYYSYTRVNCQTKGEMDFTPYKGLYFKIADNHYFETVGGAQMGTQFGYKTENEGVQSIYGMMIYDTAVAIGGSYGSTEDDAAVMYIDISKINQVCRPFIAKYGYHAGRIYSVWLA